MRPYRQKTPWWYTLLIVVLMCPALVMPMLMSTVMRGPETRFLTLMYPAYVVATGICAYITYPERRTISWILLILMLLCHVGIIALAIVN